MDIEATARTSQVISHAGIKSPFSTDKLVCPSCGSGRDLRYTRRGEDGVICGICKYNGKPTLQSIFTAQLIRDGSKL